MAFPRLVLQGNTTKGYIDNIYLKSDSDQLFDAALTRVKYTVRRQLIQKNVGQATPIRKPDIPYDQWREIHNWIGYVDVMSDSVTYASTGEQNTTWTLLKGAIIYKGDIPYGVASPADESVASGSLGTVESIAFEPAPFWVTNDPSTGNSVNATGWVIKSIDVQDNNNATSRVTFDFEVVSIWDAIYDAMT